MSETVNCSGHNCLYIVQYCPATPAAVVFYFKECQAFKGNAAGHRSRAHAAVSDVQISGRSGSGKR